VLSIANRYFSHSSHSLRLLISFQELLYCLAVGFCLMIAGAVMIPAYGDPARGAVVVKLAISFQMTVEFPSKIC
jgi:hypothetical protein